MMRTATIRVVAGSVHKGRCRYHGCRQPILWAVVASEPGRPARTLPFTAPAPWPLSTTETDRGVRFEVWPREALHAHTCAGERPRHPGRPESSRYEAHP